MILFQFTPLREGRLTALPLLSLLFYFNSRPCGRGDHHRSPRSVPRAYFNSRPCGRGDSLLLTGLPQVEIFQFTPLREGRPRLCRLSRLCSLSNFNSRPCGRGDTTASEMSRLSSISIHAPAGGATLPGPLLLQLIAYFNSRPCGRGDLYQRLYHSSALNFNSRPCGRGDGFGSMSAAGSIFQFTPLREGRRS